MNDCNKVCICRDNPSSPEFACSCGASIVFLCSTCVMAHLREPKAHSFISLDQAVKIKVTDKVFNHQLKESSRKTIELKTEVQSYPKSKAEQMYDTHSESLQEELSILRQRNQEYILTIKNYEYNEIEYKQRIVEMEDEINIYKEECKQYMDKLCQKDSLSKEYNLKIQKLDSNLQAFYNEILSLQVRLRDLENLNTEYSVSIKDLTHQLNLYEQDMNPSKPRRSRTQKSPIHTPAKPQIIKIDDEKPPIISKSPQLPPITPQPFPVCPNSHLYFTKPFSNTLYQYNPDTNTLKSLKLYKQVSINLFCSTCCILPSGDVLIVEGVHSNSKSSFIKGGATLKFSPYTLECIKLGNLNTARFSITLVVYQGYVYALGGKKLDGKTLFSTAERMMVNGYEWKQLSDMNEARVDFGSFGRDGKVYVIGGDNSESVEYYDVENQGFYYVFNGVIGIGKNFVWEDGDRVYVFSGVCKGVLRNEFGNMKWESLDREVDISIASNIINRSDTVYFYSNIDSKIYGISYWTNQVRVVKDNL